MRSIRGFVALLAGASALSFPLTAHAAIGYSADLSPEVRPAHAPLGGVAVVDLAIHNYGPYPTESDTVFVDITAPGGTIFGPDLEQRSATKMCQVAVAHKRMTCQVAGVLYPDGKDPNGESAPTWGTLDFTVQACTTPGRVRAVYQYETKSTNNAAPLTIAVDGIIPCTRPSASASASASVPVSAKPSASASLKGSASASASATPTTVASATDLPVAGFPGLPIDNDGPDHAVSSSAIDLGILSMGLIIGGAAALMALVLLAAFSLRGRG